MHKDYLLDILILDMEKIEGRVNRTVDEQEVKLLKKCTSDADAANLKSIKISMVRSTSEISSIFFLKISRLLITK